MFKVENIVHEVLERLETLGYTRHSKGLIDKINLLLNDYALCSSEQSEIVLHILGAMKP